MYEDHRDSFQNFAIGKTYNGVKIYGFNISETGTTDLYLVNGKMVSFSTPNKAACYILAEHFANLNNDNT